MRPDLPPTPYPTLPQWRRPAARSVARLVRGLAAGLVLLCPLAAAAELLPEPRPQATTDKQPAYTAAEFALAFVGKDARVTIDGVPFGGDPEKLATIVTDAMDPGEWNYPRAVRPDTIFGRGIRFTTAPRNAYREEYRIAVSFRRDLSADVETWCRAGGADSGRAPDAAGGKTVSMAFCREDTVLAASHMGFDAAKDASDPAFGEAVTAATRSLFPEQIFHDFARSNMRLPTR